MNRIDFIKMQATGNDFVLIDNRRGMITPDEFSELARRISNRKYGVGSDGLILLDHSGNNQLVMNYKNPDGSDAGMCGNGARCFVKFANQLGYGNDIIFNVHQNKYRGVIQGSQIIIHFPLKTKVNPLEVDGDKVLQVYTNTEHIVCPVKPEMLGDDDKLINKGRRLRYHSSFAPVGTNVNFMSGNSAKEIDLQTYERGVENLTFACGTGAIASALAWHHINSGSSGDFTINVEVRGGTLLVHFSFNPSTKEYNKISLEGPADTVFEGTYHN